MVGSLLNTSYKTSNRNRGQDMETELTKRIKLLTHSYKPQMSTGEVGRTIRFADEVWTPTGSRTIILRPSDIRGECKLRKAKSLQRIRTEIYSENKR